MEHLLTLYARAYDPLYPVVCFDEKSYQLLSDSRSTLPLRAKHPRRQDYEYRRCGTRNLFVMVEPLAGQRHVLLTKRRTKADFAHAVRYLVDVLYPDAKCIELVLDNLNTHNPSSLYEAFTPEEARRILRKLEFHFTPKHGSWLNMAEIEISVLSRQCLQQRLPSVLALETQVTVWTQHRNAHAVMINWCFNLDRARTKLVRLYP